MSIELLFKGLMIGFSIAMPVGPIGLLCIRNVLTFGILCGLVTGLGAACADAIYGAMAGFGVTAISTFLETEWRLPTVRRSIVFMLPRDLNIFSEKQLIQAIKKPP